MRLETHAYCGSIIVSNEHSINHFIQFVVAENGFTLFRCSSDGESGVVSSQGEFLSRRYSLSDPSDVQVYQVPVQQRYKTFYGVLGYLFEYLNIILSSLLIVRIAMVEYYVITGDVIVCVSNVSADDACYELSPSSESVQVLFVRKYVQRLLRDYEPTVTLNERIMIYGYVFTNSSC